jgi:hypothetical protein
MARIFSAQSLLFCQYAHKRHLQIESDDVGNGCERYALVIITASSAAAYRYFVYYLGTLSFQVQDMHI